MPKVILHLLPMMASSSQYHCILIRHWTNWICWAFLILEAFTFLTVPNPFSENEFQWNKEQTKEVKGENVNSFACNFYFVLQNCINGYRKDCKLVRWTESSRFWMMWFFFGGLEMWYLWLYSFELRMKCVHSACDSEIAFSKSSKGIICILWCSPWSMSC